MGFYIFISVLILIVCLLLGLIVLIQNPKGGGLSATFGGQGNQIMGVRKTNDFLEKGTWILASVLLLLSLVAAYAIPRNSGGTANSTELTISGNPSALPTQLPGATQRAAPEAQTEAQTEAQQAAPAAQPAPAPAE